MTRISTLLSFATTAFRDHMRHKQRLAIRFVPCMLFIAIFIELWALIAREGIFNMPWPVQNVQWYVALTQMFLFLSPRLFLTIEDDVRSGNIAYFLTRPVPYIQVRFAEGLGAMTANVVLFYTFSIPFLYLYIGALPTGGWSTIITAYGLIYIGSIIHLVFQVTCGIAALWLQDSESLYRIYQKGLIVCGGLYMPITMYPEWFQKFCMLTPYYGMMYSAARPVLENANAVIILECIMSALVWLALAVTIMMSVYNVCVRKLELNGG